MEETVKRFALENVKELKEAFSFSHPAWDPAQRWLHALDTPEEKAQTRALIAELEQDLMPLDTLIAFARSEGGAQVFGPKAGQVASHAEELKAAGKLYCDCPACAAVEAILARKDQLLA